MSLFIPGQTKRSAMSDCVACVPGCERECSAVNTVRRRGMGTNGRGVPVLVSHMIVDEDDGSGNCVRQRERG